jgi:hypothetical protein
VDIQLPDAPTIPGLYGTIVARIRSAGCTRLE